MGEFTQEIGKIIRCMERVYLNGKTVVVTKVVTLKTKRLDRACLNGKD